MMSCSRPNRKCVILSSCFLFDRLPVEMVHTILGFLEVEDLEKLARTSKKSAKMVLDFLMSCRGVNLIQMRSIKYFNHKRSFCTFNKQCKFANNLSDLLKVCTLTYTVEEKIEFLYTMMKKLKWVFKVHPHLYKTEKHLNFFGFFAKQFTANWTHDDLLLAHNLLENRTGIQELVRDVLHSESILEDMCKVATVREYYSSLYLKFNDPKDHGYWAVNIVLNFSSAERARLLYVILGPPDEDGGVDWNAPLRCLYGYSVQGGTTYATLALTRLGDVIHLMSEDGRISKKDIKNLIESLMEIPAKWSPFQRGHFLVSCGQNIFELFLADVVKNGEISQLAKLLLHVTGALMLNGSNIESLVRTFFKVYCCHQVCSLDGLMKELSLHATELSLNERLHYMWNVNIQKICHELIKVIVCVQDVLKLKYGCACCCQFCAHEV